MIEPGDLHRYFAVREITTGRTIRLLGGDTRYAMTEPGVCWNYRIDPNGQRFLAESAVPTHPWGRSMRLDEVEPLPDGQGMYHPDHLRVMELSLSLGYEGSWRQYADQLATEPAPEAAAA